MSRKGHDPLKSNRTGEEGLTRRDFLRRTSAGLIGAGLTAGGLLGYRRPSQSQAHAPAILTAQEPTAATGMIYRPLGRTGHQVSLIGLGTSELRDPTVFHRAIDLGVNYIDTADCYQGGNSEVYVGEVLKTRRDEVFVATKWHTDCEATSQEMLIASAETSLRRLGVETIDLIQTHGPDREAQVTHEVVRETFLELKDAGKVRFMGFSTHSNQPAVIRAALKTGWYDCVLVAYNFLSPPEIGQAIAEAHAAGLGVIQMKVVMPVKEGHANEVFAPRGMSPYQAAIRWGAKNEKISTMIIGMEDQQKLEENLAAVGRPLQAAEEEALRQFAWALGTKPCQLCGGRHVVCPHAVTIA